MPKVSFSGAEYRLGEDKLCIKKYPSGSIRSIK